MRDVTQRRADERALREANETLEALVRSVPVAIVGLTPDGRVELWSPAAEKLFGWTRDEVIGQPLPIVPPERAAEHTGLKEAGLRGESVLGLETVRLRKDGSDVRVRIFGAPLTGGAGEIRGVMALFEDVSVEREAELARSRSEGRLHFLAEAGRVLASSLDPEVTLREVARLAVPRIADWCAIYLLKDGKPKLVEVAHKNPEKVDAARRLREHYPTDPASPHSVNAVMRTGQPLLIPEITEEMIQGAVRDDAHLALIDELRLGSALAVPLVARGVTVGAISLITESGGRRFDEDDLEFAQELATRAGLAVENARLYAEAAQSADEERALRQATETVAASTTIQEVIQAIAEGSLIATGADGSFVERITESADEIEVIAAGGAYAPEPGMRAPLRGSFAEEALRLRLPVHVSNLRQRRSPVLSAVGAACEGACSALVLPLRDGGGPIGTLVLVRNASDGFTKAQSARASTFAELGSLAFRRINLLQETMQRRAELERVTESRARLVRGFSHDLKNPLGAVDGHLELFEEGILGPLTPKQRESVSRSRNAIRSALDLIQDLVELASAEASVVELRLGPTDMASIAREVVEEQLPTAQKKGLSLVLDDRTDGPIIESDPLRAKQILGNLVSNAIKYTDEGWVKVVVEALSDAQSSYLFVRVSDSGRGISSEHRHVLFQEFGRVATDKEGAGLGLAISKRLAHALQGDITVESEAGRGSTFTLWLPMDRRLQHAPLERGDAA
jgi:PAS domain S-box-containing protein